MRLITLVFAEDVSRDTDFVCVFVEDAEEDAKNIAFLWKTLKKTLEPLCFCGRR